MSKEPNRNVYVGHRYVPKIMGEWDKSIDYEGLSIVLYQGGSYTSKKRVPVGIDILNEEFWAITGNYNAQVEYYREETERVAEDLLLKSDKSYVDTELGKKSDKSYVDTELGKKANQTYVDTELGKKSDKSYVDTELGKKSNQTYVDTELNKKTNKDDNLINVKDHGVNPNGVDVNTNEIQQVINNNVGNIYFPDGDYIIDKGLKVNKSNVNLIFSPNAFFTDVSNSLAEPFIKFEGSESSQTFTVANDIYESDFDITTTTNVTGLKPGDWVKIYSDELFDNSRTDYTKREYHKIREVFQNVITLDTPVFYSYDVSAHPVTIVKQNLLENVSVNNLNVNYEGNTISRGVEFIKCFNPYIINSRIKGFERHNINMNECISGSVTNNYTESNRDDTGLSYGIFIGSSQNTTVNDNRVYSRRTAIDVSYMSLKTVVNNNTIIKGNLNTHGCIDVVMNGNTVYDGYILLRGTRMNVSGNSVSARYLSPTGGIIFMDEMARKGHISITNNTLIGHAGNKPGNGIYGGSVNGMKDILIQGNMIDNVINGVSFGRGSDSETPINNVIVDSNIIKTYNGGTGIIGNRTEDFTVTNNKVTNMSEQQSVGIDFTSSSKVLSNVIINSNIIRDHERPVRLWQTYTECIVSNNIAVNNVFGIDNQSNATESIVVNNI